MPIEICKISGVKADGNTVTYSAACGGQPPRVMTTVFHGTASEGRDSSGSKTDAKLVGACTSPK